MIHWETPNQHSAYENKSLNDCKLTQIIQGIEEVVKTYKHNTVYKVVKRPHDIQSNEISAEDRALVCIYILAKLHPTAFLDRKELKEAISEIDKIESPYFKELIRRIQDPNTKLDTGIELLDYINDVYSCRGDAVKTVTLSILNEKDKSVFERGKSAVSVAYSYLKENNRSTLNSFNQGALSLSMANLIGFAGVGGAIGGLIGGPIGWAVGAIVGCLVGMALTAIPLICFADKYDKAKSLSFQEYAIQTFWGSKKLKQDGAFNENLVQGVDKLVNQVMPEKDSKMILVPV